MSKYGTYSVPELLALGSNLTTVLSSASGEKYGVAPSAVTALGAADAALDAAENTQKACLIAAKGATATKLAHKEDVASRIAAIQAIVTANPLVTDAELVGLGFPARRGTSPRPKLPVAATDLSATPDALGNVKLRWTKGTNGTTVVYMIETSLNAGATWSLLDTTKRSSIVATGFAPGVAAWFRVTATGAAGRAQPSAPASIYAPTPEVALSLAA